MSGTELLTHRVRTRRRSLVSALALTAVLALLAPLAEPTGADIDAKRAEAERIAERLDELQIELSQLDEENNQARIALEQLDADVDDASERVAQAEEELAERRRELRDLAVDSYITGGDIGELEGVLSTESDRIPQHRAYSLATTGSRQELVDQIEVVRQATESEIAELEGAREEAEAVRDRMRRARDAAAERVAEMEELQSRVEGELADLVAEVEAERAAAERSRAEEAAREAAERIAAERATSTTTTTAAPEPPPEAPAEPEPSPPPASGDMEAILAAARSQLGTPYVWGGSSPETGFDCSGFTRWAYAHGGHDLPHSAEMQLASMRSVPVSEVRPGDLVFYGSPIHHVGMYVGDGQIIHAPGSGRTVEYQSMHYSSNIAGVGRL